jgi:hypothetical protein
VRKNDGVHRAGAGRANPIYLKPGLLEQTLQNPPGEGAMGAAACSARFAIFCSGIGAAAVVLVGSLSVPNLYHAGTAFVSDLRQRLRSGFLTGLAALGGNKVCHLGRALDVEAVHHLLQHTI